MHALICLGLALFLAPAAQSPFNSYAVFLSPRQLPGTCADEDLEQFRNRTYTFRSDIYPGKPITLRNGKVIERNPLGTPEWETSLTAAEPLKIASRQATLLIIGSNHVHGSGGATHVLVVECRKRALIVWFEASGEGVRDASFTAGDQDLTVSRWIWSSTDAHCCPSKEAEERYRWRPGGRFVRVSRAERPAPK
jgi:hypothetical protein